MVSVGWDMHARCSLRCRMPKFIYGFTAGIQCTECTRPAKARGLCTSHYSLWRRAQREPRWCTGCGILHQQTSNLCASCYGRLYRQSKAKEVAANVETVSDDAAPGWPHELDTWTTLHKCKSPAALRQYLSARSTGEVWPHTDHSLACWLSSQRHSNHFCFCQPKEAR